MLISRKYRFIFVHIPKNAGRSIRAALYPFVYYNGLHKFFIDACKKAGIRPPLKLNPNPFIGSHNYASEIIDVVGRQIFDECFSFAIVRNPWDWHVSYYAYHVKLKNPTHPLRKKIQAFPDFTAYIRWRCENPEFQKDFIYSADGKLLANFVGRYENLEEDFKTICNRIGIGAELPRINVSKTKPYQEYYVPETVELVRKTFAADIRLFGYDFE